MAIGDEGRKSYASDEATYNLDIQSRDAGGGSAYALGSFIVSKKPVLPTTHRAAYPSSADTSSPTYAGIVVYRRATSGGTLNDGGTVNSSIGTYMTPGNGYLYRTSTTGQAVGTFANITWPTTPGDYVNDGSVGWYCYSTLVDVGNSSAVEVHLRSASSSGTWTFYVVMLDSATNLSVIGLAGPYSVSPTSFFVDPPTRFIFPKVLVDVSSASKCFLVFTALPGTIYNAFVVPV